MELLTQVEAVVEQKDIDLALIIQADLVAEATGEKDLTVLHRVVVQTLEAVAVATRALAVQVVQA
jgi:hypothetical protein